MASKFLKNNLANKKFKIGSLIAIQILIIITSFIVISQFTIQSENLGNTINLSGSNRFLGELLFVNTEHHPIENDLYVAPHEIISNIDTNLYLLEHGGNPSEIMEENKIIISAQKNIMPLPSSLTLEFNELKLAWQEYKNSILEQFNNDQEQSSHINFEDVLLKNQFIENANLMTDKLSSFSMQEKNNLYNIQIFLLFVNVLSHLFLLFLIVKIITKEEKILTRAKSLEAKNEGLVDELTAVLMKKNSIQLTSSLLLHELQETEKLTREHEFVSEKDRVKYFWDNFYKNVLNHVEDLEKSRKKYDDEKSYYEQLNQRFKHGINLLNGKNKTTTNPDSLDNTLDDLRDFINSLSESGMISPENNRVLTNVLNDIIDSKLRQNSKHT